MDNDDFGEEITSKPYLKYVYQPAKKGPKTAEKEAFLRAIDDFSNHLYGENPSKKRGRYFFCTKKSNLKPSKKQELGQFSSYSTFQLNKEDNAEIWKEKGPKREEFRGKMVKWWCQECNKFICKDCWSLYH